MDIKRAAERLSAFKGKVIKTPLVHSPALSEETGVEVYLKLECVQAGGSFKIRGALNYAAARKEEGGIGGFVTCSSGNHGAALSYASSLIGGVATTVFVPQGAEETKIEKIRRYGAEVRVGGKDFLEAYAAARRFAERHSLEYVHSHSHPFVIAGQGTIGLEIAEDLPTPGTVIVPVGGGGLISGIAIALRHACDTVKVLGVEAEAAPGAFLSFRDGYCHESVDIRPSLADGLLGTLTPLTYRLARPLVERIFTVSEEEIRRAMGLFYRREQLVIEGGASVGLAALLSGRIEKPAGPVVLVLTGRNIGAEKFLSAVGASPPPG